MQQKQVAVLHLFFEDGAFQDSTSPVFVIFVIQYRLGRMRHHAPGDYVCPFCALVAGSGCEGLYSTPGDIICRDELSLAFISSHWAERNAGHVLVASVKHFENIYELPDEVGSAILPCANESRSR